MSIETEIAHRAKSNASAYLTIRMPSTASIEVETVSAEEKEAFKKSSEAVRKTCDEVDEMLKTL